MCCVEYGTETNYFLTFNRIWNFNKPVLNKRQIARTQARLDIRTNDKNQNKAWKYNVQNNHQPDIYYCVIILYVHYYLFYKSRYVSPYDDCRVVLWCFFLYSCCISSHFITFPLQQQQRQACAHCIFLHNLSDHFQLSSWAVIGGPLFKFTSFVQRYWCHFFLIHISLLYFCCHHNCNFVQLLQ